MRVNTAPAFIAHVQTLIDLLHEGDQSDDIDHKIFIRDSIEAIVFVSVEDDSVFEDAIIADILHRAVMTCAVSGNAFANVRDAHMSSEKTDTWFSLMTRGDKTSDVEVMSLLCSLRSAAIGSESLTTVVSCNKDRSHYFNNAEAYIRIHIAGDMRLQPFVNSVEQLTRSLSSYTTRQRFAPIGNVSLMNVNMSDFKESLIAVTKIRIDQEHDRRIQVFDAGQRVEYNTRASLIRSGKHVDDEHTAVLIAELDDELADRREQFDKRLRNERSARLSIMSSQVDTLRVTYMESLRLLRQMCAHVRK